MEWRHSGSLRPQKNSECKNPLENFPASIFFFGIKAAFSSLVIIQRVNVSISHLLLVQMKDTLKVKRRGKVTNGVLFLHYSAPAHRAHATHNKTGLSGFPMSWSPTLFSGYDSVGLQPVPWTKKKIERWTFFVRRGRSLLPWRLDWTYKLLIFLSGLQKLK